MIEFLFCVCCSGALLSLLVWMCGMMKAVDLLIDRVKLLEEQLSCTEEHGP